MAASTGLFAKLINVLIFNYMVTVGELKAEFNQDDIRVSFADLYGAMIATPFFGTYYN